MGERRGEKAGIEDWTGEDNKGKQSWALRERERPNMPLKVGQKEGEDHLFTTCIKNAFPSFLLFPFPFISLQGLSSAFSSSSRNKHVCFSSVHTHTHTHTDGDAKLPHNTVMEGILTSPIRTLTTRSPPFNDS